MTLGTWGANWEWYDLAVRNRRKIAAIGRGFGIGDSDSASVAADVALRLCFDCRVIDSKQAARAFWADIRWAFRNFHRAQKHVLEGDLIERYDRWAKDLSPLERLPSGRTEGNQIDYTYLCQTLREIDLLPSRLRSVMMMLCTGHTPLEIAEVSDRAIEHVLDDMRVARAWLTSADGVETQQVDAAPE